MFKQLLYGLFASSLFWVMAAGMCVIASTTIDLGRVYYSVSIIVATIVMLWVAVTIMTAISKRIFQPNRTVNMALVIGLVGGFYLPTLFF